MANVTQRGIQAQLLFDFCTHTEGVTFAPSHATERYHDLHQCFPASKHA